MRPSSLASRLRRANLATRTESYPLPLALSRRDFLGVQLGLKGADRGRIYWCLTIASELNIAVIYYRCLISASESSLDFPSVILMVWPKAGTGSRTASPDSACSCDGLQCCSDTRFRAAGYAGTCFSRAPERVGHRRRPVTFIGRRRKGWPRKAPPCGKC
jgi:hypothetical protein